MLSDGYMIMKSCKHRAGTQRRLICCWIKRSLRTPLPFAVVAVCNRECFNGKFWNSFFSSWVKWVKEWSILPWDATVHSMPGEDPIWERRGMHWKGRGDDPWTALQLNNFLPICRCLYYCQNPFLISSPCLHVLLRQSITTNWVASYGCDRGKER